MCCGKYIQNLIITLISSIILLIFLLQIYCEYSSIAIKNTNLHNRMNLKNSIIKYPSRLKMFQLRNKYIFSILLFIIDKTFICLLNF